jgi:hypothetical protein
MKATPVCLVFSVALYAQQVQGPLSDQRIMALAMEGVSGQEILRIIASASEISFDLTPVATDAMLKAGVSAEAIKAMAARESGIPARAIAAPTSAPVRNSYSPATSTALPSAISAAPATRVANPILRPGASIASSEAYKLTYDGGSIPNFKPGTGMKLYLDSNQIRIVKDHADVLSLPASAVTEISYGQDVHRRVGAAIGLATISFGIGALMALTKSKKHFIGLTWDDGGNKGGVAFQADKNDYRGVLAGLEGITGRKAVNSDTMTVKN